MGDPADLRAAIEALRRPLSFAARDGFAHLERVADLGGTLAGAGARLAALLDGERAQAVGRWAGELARFQEQPRTAQEQLVARGMRLCATAAMDVPRPPAPRAAPPGSGAPKLADLDAPLLGLPGAGPRTVERLIARGVRTVGDALHFVPRRWDDLRALTPVGQLTPGLLQITRARVKSARVVFGRRRFFEVTLEGDDGAPLKALWFYLRGGMKERFPPGARFLLAGTPRESKWGLQIAHPETTLLAPDEEGEAAESGAVRARYPEVEGVPNRTVARLCRAAVERAAELVPDGLPEKVRARRRLPSQAESLAELHLAGTADDPPRETVDALNAGTAPAQRRLAFDELFFLQLGLARRRQLVAAVDAPACPPAPAALARFRAALPFTATAAQARAIAEIERDLALPHPMHRLLQGDVGSGKTLVAFAAALQAIAAKCQVAVMAPTELLAEQHARTMAAWARATGVRFALLTASTPRGARESTLTLLAAGQIDLLVGTHALLAEAVCFHRLGLVVIDEQHRFGVQQRATLRDKGGAASPHLLVMTATPIPRTLALTAYGDLEQTLLDELPPGRTPAVTRVCAGERARAGAYLTLRKLLSEGKQGYVVCPLVEESSKLDVADAVATYERLQAELPGIAIGLAHGRLPADERDRVMARFGGGEVRLLVATTVVEVGVDVPAAEVMLIDGAERFGLAQLHQLRGRIGRRPGGQPLCLLVTSGPRTNEATARLEVMAESTDGFVIAEQDLKQRGPGELYGTRQAGLPRLRFADLARDLDLLRAARDDAFALLTDNPELARAEHATTKRVLEARWEAGQLFGEEAG